MQLWAFVHGRGREECFAIWLELRFPSDKGLVGADKILAPSLYYKIQSPNIFNFSSSPLSPTPKTEVFLPNVMSATKLYPCLLLVCIAIALMPKSRWIWSAQSGCVQDQWGGNERCRKRESKSEKGVWMKREESMKKIKREEESKRKFMWRKKEQKLIKE